jgi:uncharacterized RDD family membrane protein YckC
MTPTPLGQVRSLEGELTPPIAGFWRRIAAFAADCVIIGVPAFLLGLVFFRWAVALDQAGRLIGFVVALLYFALLNSRLGGGQTLGKRLFGIRVIDRNGNALNPMRSVVRFLVLAIPYFLNGISFDLDPTSKVLLSEILGASLIFIVFGGLGAIMYLLIFNRRTRQSLHDLAVDSFVVRDRPIHLPIDLFTPRLHLIVIGSWLVVTLIVPGTSILISSRSGLLEQVRPLSGLQATIPRRVPVHRVKVIIASTTFATIRAGSSTQSVLRVDAQPNELEADLDALLLRIADVVLDVHPDLLGKQVLIVNVRRGFDLGIASWNVGRQEQLDAAGWREKLRQSRGRPGTA